jgi:hypothetical protein
MGAPQDYASSYNRENNITHILQDYASSIWIQYQKGDLYFLCGFNDLIIWSIGL